jgi:hypothetical protein
MANKCKHGWSTDPNTGWCLSCYTVASVNPNEGLIVCGPDKLTAERDAERQRANRLADAAQRAEDQVLRMLKDRDTMQARIYRLEQELSKLRRGKR